MGDCDFREYLENGTNEKNKYRQIALTTKSYKNIEHNLTDQDVNCELATYGDALLRLALCKILFKQVKNITEVKKEYESDEILVRVVAKNYCLINHIRFDKNDKKIPRDYEYDKSEKGSSHKYIATTVEALLAAFYLDRGKTIKSVVDIVKEWKKMIDESKKHS